MPSLTDTALDAQADLFGYYGTAMGESYAGGEFAIMAKTVGMSSDRRESVEAFADREAPKVMRNMLRTAATFAVADDICTVLEVAAKKLKPYELHGSDLPSLNGFVWLERSVVFRDDTPERKPMVVRAIGWYSTMFTVGETGKDESGVMLCMFTDPFDERDHSHASFTEVGQIDLVSPPLGLWSMMAGIWPYGSTPAQAASEDVMMFLLAFLRFIDEPWIEPGWSIPSRSAGRRAARKQIEPQVRVIRLRKRKERSEGTGEGTGYKWTRRVLVGAATGGFWRNQWYPAKAIHRDKWIWPFEAGPEDAPLEVPDRVYRVDR